MDVNPLLWKGKRVLVTGHTGFKGSWLSFILSELGAEVVGLSLPPPEIGYSLYKDARISQRMKTECFLDIRNELEVEKFIKNSNPDYVFHLAAQALVGNSLLNPIESITTNVSGTANVLLSSLKLSKLRGITIVTTDKVYQNLNNGVPFTENDRLGNKDPYSASKAAAEIIVNSLASSCNPYQIQVTTARAGNVIGGGDWGEKRLIPDLVGTLVTGNQLDLRAPNSTRPWQHILDCIRGYLMLAQAHMLKNTMTPVSINFGPTKSLCVMDLVNIFEMVFNTKIDYRIVNSSYEEAKKLELNSQLAWNFLSWENIIDPIDAVTQTANWYLQFTSGIAAEKLLIEEYSNFRFNRW